MSLRMSLSRLTILAAVVLPSCANQLLEGPPQDLHDLATPEPPPVVRPAAVPGPSAAPGRWRVWVPPQTTRAGDIVEGHWLDLTLAPPRVDVVAPAAPMPRAPKTPGGALKTPPPGGTPVQPAAPAPAAAGQPGGVAPAAVTRVPTPRLPHALRNVPPALAEEMR